MAIEMLSHFIIFSCFPFIFGKFNSELQAIMPTATPNEKRTIPTRTVRRLFKFKVNANMINNSSFEAKP